jgi:phospholipid/cholesterol/gamma-HCH transport system substrate-binding protein
MESPRGQEFKVGLLMVAGIAAIILIVIWTDPVSFASYYQLTAYLDNAGGLRNGSPVTLSGIRVGQVMAIDTNADDRGAIRCLLRLDTRYPIDASSELQLLTSGIFGDSYLEFGPSDDGRRGEFLPQDGSAWVRVSPGLIDEVSRQGKEIVAGVVDLLDQENRDNLGRLLVNLADASERIDGLLQGIDETTRASAAVLAELRNTTVDLRQRAGATLAGVDAVSGLAGERLPPLFDSLGRVSDQGLASLQRIDGLVARMQEQMTAVDPAVREAVEGLRSAVGEIHALVAGLRQGEGVIGQLLSNRLLAEDVSDTLVNAKVASERIADHPEVLIWGQTIEEQAAQAERRREMQARRAFTAGLRGRSAFQPEAGAEAEPAQ